MKKYLNIICWTVLGIVMIVGIILFSIKAYGDQPEEIEETDSQEKTVEANKKTQKKKNVDVSIEELIESANIEGTFWLDWSVEELTDYYAWDEYNTYMYEDTGLSVMNLDDEISHFIAYSYGSSPGVDYCGTHVSWDVYEEDNRIIDDIYSWGKQSYLRGDKDYSDGGGFLGYMYEKKCASIEDLLKLWNIKKADPEFMEAYEAGEDYSTTLLTEYGETGFRMYFGEDGDRIVLFVDFPREYDEDKVHYGCLSIMEQTKGKDKDFSIDLMLRSAQ